jgi:tetratricopeptide (TPR) repeat protein
MTRKERELMLNTYSEKGVEVLVEKGAIWFYQVYLENLQIATNTKSVDEGVLSDCWFIAGDMFDLVFAPLQAKAAYENAVDLDPDFAEAYFELATVCRDLGMYDEAIENIETALELAEFIDDYHIEAQTLQTAIEEAKPAFYNETNEKWPFYETLASKKLEIVLEMSNLENDAFHAKMRSFAFNLLEKKEESSLNWKFFVGDNLNYEMNLVERFYLS